MCAGLTWKWEVATEEGNGESTKLDARLSGRWGGKGEARVWLHYGNSQFICLFIWLSQPTESLTTRGRATQTHGVSHFTGIVRSVLKCAGGELSIVCIWLQAQEIWCNVTFVSVRVVEERDGLEKSSKIKAAFNDPSVVLSSHQLNTYDSLVPENHLLPPSYSLNVLSSLFRLSQGAYSPLFDSVTYSWFCLCQLSLRLFDLHSELNIQNQDSRLWYLAHP